MFFESSNLFAPTSIVNTSKFLCDTECDMGYYSDQNLWQMSYIFYESLRLAIFVIF